MLPVEFARESRDGRITLVICPDAPRVPTLWSVLDVPDLQTARNALGVREYDDAGPKWIAKNIGFWNGADGSSRGLEADTIATWATPRGFCGVIWTNLPPKFKGVDGFAPSEDALIDYLQALTGAARVAAEKYVRKTPAQISTRCRLRIARELGWTHRP